MSVPHSSRTECGSAAIGPCDRLADTESLVVEPVRQSGSPVAEVDRSILRNDLILPGGASAALVGPMALDVADRGPSDPRRRPRASFCMT
jgi:hypothetical protein